MDGNNDNLAIEAIQAQLERTARMYDWMGLIASIVVAVVCTFLLTFVHPLMALVTGGFVLIFALIMYVKWRPE